LKIATFAASQLNTEKKHVDRADASMPGDTNLDFELLNGIAQGDGNENRDGTSVKFLTLFVKGFMRISSSTSRTLVRVLIIHDKVPDGSLPSTSDILDNSDINGMYNTENMGAKYQILLDRTYTLSDGSGQTRPFKIFKKLGTKSRYSGTGSTLADISQGAYYIAFLSDESVNVPSISWRSRMMFVDN